MRISDWSSDVCSSDLEGRSRFSTPLPQMGFISHRTKASGAARGGMSSSPDTIMARLPPLTSMEAFLEVARPGTVKAAPSELGLSMPALSRRLQPLGHAVGRPLFDRPPPGFKLPQAGPARPV